VSPGGSSEGVSAHPARLVGLGSHVCWRQAYDVPVCRCRAAMRSRGGLALMLSHRANVASIVSWRAELAAIGDLIKPPIVHKSHPEAPIHPDL